MKYKFKSGVILLAFILILTMTAEALSDIDGHWAKPYIEDLVNEGAVSGYPDGSYRPENNIKVGEFLKICVLNFGNQEEMEKPSEGHWALPYQQSALALNYLSSNDDDLDNLNSLISRAQIARILGRVADQMNLNLGPDIYSEGSSVTDFDQLKDRDRLGVLYMLRMGVIEGYKDGSFKGDRAASRGELAAIIHRFKHPKIASANPAYKNIVITEGDGINTSYFSITLKYDRELEPQLEALELYLENKLSVYESEDIMDYVRSKKDYNEALPPRVFPWKRGFITVVAPRNAGTLTIIAD